MTMCGKVLAIVAIVVAVVLAALASFLPATQIDYVVAVSRFFDIMIPVLAVGALIKYLCKCAAGCNCPCCSGKQGGSCGK
jgi:ABC-type dipeptide/oligopeptide/nickel transport system permease component